MIAFLAVWLAFAGGWGAANASVTPDLDPAIAQLARFEIFRERAFQLPLEGGELGPLFEAMRAELQATTDPAIARHGAVILLKTMRQLGQEEQAAKECAGFLESQFASCSTFSSCELLLAEISELTEVNPQAVKSHLGSSLRAAVTRLEDSLPRRILMYRLDSLRALGEFYAASGTHLPSRQGLIPSMPPERKAVLVDLLDGLDEDYAGLRPEPRSPWESEAEHAARVRDFYQVLARDLGREGAGGEGELVAGVARTDLGNQSLRLYLDRLDRRNLAPWLAKLDQQLRDGALSPELVFVMTLRFGELESYLPFRADWLGMMERSAALAGDLDGIRPLLAGYRGTLVLRDRQLREFLTQQGYFRGRVTEPRDTSLADILLREEKRLSIRFLGFQSLFARAERLTARQNRLAAGALEMKKAVEGERVDEVQDAWKNAVAHRQDLALADWIELACYAEYATGSGLRSSASLPIFFAQGDSHSTHDACRWNRLAGPESDVADYVAMRRKISDLKPLAIEAAIMLATLPISVASAGVAGVVSRPVAALATRVGVALATRAALGRLTTALATRMIPKVAAAISGAAAFTATQRLILAGVTLGHIPLFDSKKTLLENYGKDLVFGSTLFFFLPYSSAFAGNLGAKLAPIPMIGKSAPAVAEIAVDTAVFTSVPYIERVISNLHEGEDRPILKGWNDFSFQAGFSALTSVVFRVRWGAMLTKKL